MAKDNRTILSGIRVGSDVFTDGAEDELAAVLSPADGKRLLEAGAIAGDWDFGGSKPEPLPRDEFGTPLNPVEAAKAKAEKKAAQLTK